MGWNRKYRAILRGERSAGKSVVLQNGLFPLSIGTRMANVMFCHLLFFL